MFLVKKTASEISVETGNSIYRWHADNGGFLTECIVKESNAEHRMFDRATSPAIIMTIDGRSVDLSACKATLVPEYEDGSRLVFNAVSEIEGVFQFEQEYSVFEEGAVFCEFRIVTKDDCSAAVSDVEMRVSLDIRDAKNVRSNYMSRELYIKQDVTVPHILGSVNVARPRTESIRKDHLVPSIGLDLGWGKTRHYSNRVEICLEDSTSFGNNMLGETTTVSEEVDGTWITTWRIGANVDETFEPPFFYRNKWALFCASARTLRGGAADPVKRNNVMGAKICHVMYPYVYGRHDWPWCSVPLKQCFYQDVQLAKENPGLERIDEAVALGAEILIIHQFWMSCGGSNGEPMASYQPHDPEWLRAFVDKAHANGMRVLFYIRGIEQYMMYSDFFETYLKKDWDGLYIDWASPFLMGFAKSTVKHSSIYNWFMFMRALREKVGKNGVLIGHTTMQSPSNYALFDVALTGEFSVLHSGLLAEPEISTSYAGQSCCGLHLIAGNAPDRRAFSSQKALAYAAGLGWSNHPFMEPGFEFAHSCGFTLPLWKLLARLDGAPVRMVNPSAESTDGMTWSDENLYPLAYIDGNGNALVLVANLSETTVDGSVTLNPAAMGLGTDAKIIALDEGEGTHTARIEGEQLVFESMAPYKVSGILLKAPQG